MKFCLIVATAYLANESKALLPILMLDINVKMNILVPDNIIFHHILMIGIALPIGWFVDSKSLLGYSLFFTTGLPGGIDYFLLFLVELQPF